MDKKENVKPEDGADEPMIPAVSIDCLCVRVCMCVWNEVSQICNCNSLDQDLVTSFYF